MVDMSSCLSICGYISSNASVVTSQTSNATSINCCVTPLYSSFSSSLESKISTGSYYVALGFGVTHYLLFKMFFRKCSNIGYIDSWMLSTHQIVTPIPISNLLSSSNSNVEGDSKGEIATNGQCYTLVLQPIFPIPYTLFIAFQELFLHIFLFQISIFSPIL